MNKLAKILKVLRENKFLSQTNMAKQLNISSASISNYERGISSPDIDTLILFANFFNISIDSLVGRTIPKNEIAPEDQDFINIIKELKPEDKQVLKDIAKNF